MVNNQVSETRAYAIRPYLHILQAKSSIWFTDENKNPNIAAGVF